MVRFLRMLMLLAVVLVAMTAPTFAVGDLFDDDYTDCPRATRLSSGEVFGLDARRSSSDANDVNVSWLASNPGTWGLGANAYNTSLVVRVKGDAADKATDGGMVTETLPLSSTSKTINLANEIKTTSKLKVQLAIVTEVGGNKYVISDILETGQEEGMKAPLFSSELRQMKAEGTNADLHLEFDGSNAEDTDNYRDLRYGWLKNDGTFASDSTEGDPDWWMCTLTTATPPVCVPNKWEPFKEPNINDYSDPVGTMFYIGYNEQFGNYKVDKNEFVTEPSTPRLRIGLRHDGTPPDNLDTYLIRITDESGDVVTAADDVRAFKSTGYADSVDHDSAETLPDLPISERLWMYEPAVIGAGAKDISNVRVREGNTTVRPFHDVHLLTDDPSFVGKEQTMSRTKVAAAPGVCSTTNCLWTANSIFAEPPHYHRDLPLDTLGEEETYTISAWALSEEGNAMSPRATLRVRPVDTRRGSGKIFHYIRGKVGTEGDNTTGTVSLFDYLNPKTATNTDDKKVIDTESNATLTTTEFTVYPDTD